MLRLGQLGGCDVERGQRRPLVDGVPRPHERARRQVHCDTSALLRREQEQLETRVVLLTAMATDAELYDTIDAGAAGVVVKDAGPETLLECIRTVAAGGNWLPEGCR